MSLFGKAGTLPLLLDYYTGKSRKLIRFSKWFTVGEVGYAKPGIFWAGAAVDLHTGELRHAFFMIQLWLHSPICGSFPFAQLPSTDNVSTLSPTLNSLLFRPE